MVESNGEKLKVIKTSEKGWFIELAKAYKKKKPISVIDDANVGFDPKRQFLLEIGRKAKLKLADWVAVLISLGVSAVGAWMVALAFVDPEPTSKLTLLVAGGILLVGTGGLFAIRIITKIKPPTIEKRGNDFRIAWE